MKTDMRTAQIERKPQARWDYRSEVMEASADMSQFGTEGWELVSVVPVSHDPGNVTAYFKRAR